MEGGDTRGRSTEFQLMMFRHGQTHSNAERRYVGSTDDQPLSPLGREEALSAAAFYEDYGFAEVRRVYVSELRRTHETAAILFPAAEQVVVPGIQEMDFGVFTGRTADEMADDSDYRAWVEGMCEGQCPGGESKAQFDERVCDGMLHLCRSIAESGEQRAYLVAHGGTLMAFLSRFADEQRSYYDWLVGNCQGYRMTVSIDTDGKLSLRDVERL